jgi:hypothetical protein
MIIVGLCGLGLIALSFGSISYKYIYQKFQNTQYSKICWFLQKCERGDFSEQEYKGIFIGSSQVYYGINDSILGSKYLNLGFNTPSKDMDLYVLETFFECGGKAERVFLGGGGDKLVSYGIHPLMPYLVSPKWLLMHGQKWYSLHFWKFMIIRSQKVIESVIAPLDENTIELKTNYGVGYLDRMVGRIKPFNEIQIQKNRFNNQNQVNALDELRNNIRSQWSFLEEIKSKYKPQILVMPSYLSADKFEKLQQSVQENRHLNGLKIVGLDVSFNEVLESQQYWADPGHLNRLGGIKFSNELKKVIGIEN